MSMTTGDNQNHTTDYDYVTSTHQNSQESFFPPPPLISNELYHLLFLIFEAVAVMLIGVVGITANIVNVSVYVKLLGNRDSITLGFLTLSVSDLVINVCSLLYSIRFIADSYFIPEHSPIDMESILFVSAGKLREMAYHFSNFLTAFLSVERCCCVVFPFKVKTWFTFERSRVIIMCLFTVVLLCYGPVFTTVQLRWMEHPLRNDSQILGLWFAPHRKYTHFLTFYFIGIFSSFVTATIVVCSMAVMLSGLRETSKFRQTMAKVNNDVPKSGQKGKSSNLSDRDARLVKVMIFLGAIFTSCNAPYLVFVITAMNIPDLGFGRRYENTYLFLYLLVAILALVNASMNVFVYYLNSSRYRDTCQQMFPCLGQSKNKNTEK